MLTEAHDSKIRKAQIIICGTSWKNEKRKLLQIGTGM